MKNHKLNIITLMHMICAQKREITDLKVLLKDQKKTIDRLRLEKEHYRRECMKRQVYADLLTPISTRVEHYANGGGDEWD